jgi:opacity protein-like surface antigen
MRRHVAPLVLFAALSALAAGTSFADALEGPVRRAAATRDRPQGRSAEFGDIYRHTILRAHVGLSEPTGDFGDGLQSGFGIGASVGYGVSRKVVLSGNLAYHRFDLDGASGHVSVTPFTLNADVVLPSSGRVVPWVGGGFGVYHVSEEVPIFLIPVGPFGAGGFSVSENDPGINFGMGLGVPTSRGMLFGGGVKFHHVWGNDFVDADFLTLQVGMAFDL